MLVIGGDYYTYSQRELLSETKDRWSFVLQHHSIAAALLYFVLLPAQLLIFVFDLLPWHLAGWFFALLVAEHGAQEINRLLVAMQRQILASLVLLVRMGLWVWVALGLMWINPSYRQIETVFAAWLVGALLAAAAGFVVVWREGRPWRSWPVDWTWLRKGFAVALLYLIATTSFRSLMTFDRYFVEALAGQDYLGVYVLYIGMAMAVISVVDAGVFFFLYPKLVAAQRQDDMVQVRKLMKELTIWALGVSIVIGLLVGLFAPWTVVTWIGNPLYAEHLHVLWLLLLMAVIYALGMVAHYGLYAHGADKSILFAHISSLLVFFTAVTLLANLLPFEATAVALNLGFAWMGMLKYLRLRKVRLTASAEASSPTQ
ncbi:lipopolysaccharide biosynthesis protein [Sulfitobacter sp. 1A16787]|uniref:lipopolysaccharide biosynthesis protein n=1 Tax=Sulfitobacter sp. 1A16787 TaxID=3368571 RepID=UPI003745875C